jgi:hypothetical protein
MYCLWDIDNVILIDVVALATHKGRVQLIESQGTAFCFLFLGTRSNTFWVVNRPFGTPF